MVSFRCIIRGKLCKFTIEKKVIFLMTESTGGHLVRLGKPLEMKKTILMSRNKMPSFMIEFVNAWRPEDILRVSKMETDQEMVDDMIKDFKLSGYEILKDGV